MHKLLEEKITQHFGSLEAVPDELQGFIKELDDAYKQVYASEPTSGDSPKLAERFKDFFEKSGNFAKSLGGTNQPNGDAALTPISIRGQEIGALGVANDPEKPLTEDEKNLLESVSIQVAEALERARLFEESQRSAAELAVLNQSASAFSESLDINAIVENIYKYASQLMDTEEFFVALYGARENELTFPLAIHKGQQVTENHPHWEHWQPRPADAGLTGHIVSSRRSLLLGENARDYLESAGLDFRQHAGETQSWLGVPILFGDRVLGVIAAQSDTEANLYNERHLDLLTALAGQAAIAMENTQLFQQEQARAEQERMVRTITDLVRRGGNKEAILRITLEELSKVLKADESVIRLGTKQQLLEASHVGFDKTRQLPDLQD
jgi:GAF domain-containing protein